MDIEVQQKLSAMSVQMGRLTNLYIKWSQKHNINYNTMSVLKILLTEEGLITQKQISEKYSLPKQTVNNVIRSLMNEGYVILVAEEKDKREKKILLSEKGLEFSKELLFPLVEIEERVMRKVGIETAQQLLDALSEFGDTYEQEMR